MKPTFLGLLCLGCLFSGEVSSTSFGLRPAEELLMESQTLAFVRIESVDRVVPGFPGRCDPRVYSYEIEISLYETLRGPHPARFVCSLESFCLDCRALLAVGTESDRRAVWHGWNVEQVVRGFGIRPNFGDPLLGAFPLRAQQASICGRNRRNCWDGELYQYIPLRTLRTWVARQPLQPPSR